MSPKGINNWREAVWFTITLLWLCVHLAAFVGYIDISLTTIWLGTQLLAYGLFAHVIWLNLIKPDLAARRTENA